MILQLDMHSNTPIYLQLRNQIVLGIGRGTLQLGEQLPTVRQLASDIGVNAMTVSKAYGILKTEGFIETDRRNGAKIAISNESRSQHLFQEKLEEDLELLLIETKLSGKTNEEILTRCKQLIESLQITQATIPTMPSPNMDVYLL